MVARECESRRRVPLACFRTKTLDFGTVPKCSSRGIKSRVPLLAPKRAKRIWNELARRDSAHICAHKYWAYPLREADSDWIRSLLFQQS